MMVFKGYLLFFYAAVSMLLVVGCVIFARMTVRYEYQGSSLPAAGTVSTRHPTGVGTAVTGRRFSAAELKQFDGQEGRPAYTARGGVVYDVSGSGLWKNGRHAGLHSAGYDLSESLDRAPHDERVFEGLPVVGELGEKPSEIRNRLQGVMKLRLHSILVHFSIAYTFLIPFLAVLFLFTGNVAFDIASYYLLGLGFAATILAGLSGLLSWRVTYRGSTTRIFAFKTLLTVFMIAVMAICFVWRSLEPQILASQTFFSYLYLALLVSEIPLAAILGHLGGEIVYA